jgi:hypothetical protein
MYHTANRTSHHTSDRTFNRTHTHTHTHTHARAREHTHTRTHTHTHTHTHLQTHAAPRQNLLNRLLTVDLPGLMVLPQRLEVSIPPSVTSIAEAAVGRDTIMRAVASAVLQVRAVGVCVCVSEGVCVCVLRGVCVDVASANHPRLHSVSLLPASRHTQRRHATPSHITLVTLVTQVDSLEQALLAALPLGPQAAAGGVSLPESFRVRLCACAHVRMRVCVSVCVVRRHDCLSCRGGSLVPPHSSGRAQGCVRCRGCDTCRTITSTRLTRAPVSRAPVTRRAS